MEATAAIAVLKDQQNPNGNSSQSEQAVDPAHPWTSIPPASGSVIETGLPLSVLEDLALKVLRSLDRPRLMEIAEALCLQPQVALEIVESLTRRKLAEVQSADSPLSLHYRYSLTDAGKMAADDCLRRCHYVGAAPVPIEHYCAAVLRQAQARIR